MTDISTLPFMAERLPLLNSANLRKAADKSHSQDRTMKIIHKWQRVSGEIKAAKHETVSCLSASEEKGKVVFKVEDRQRFDELQEYIGDLTNALKILEDTIRKVDELSNCSTLWYSELSNIVSSLESTEPNHKKRLANAAAEVLVRRGNTSKDVDTILEQDERFQQLKKVTDEDPAAANRDLSTKKPKLDELNSILLSVDC